MRIVAMGEVYSSGDAVITIAGMFDVNPSGLEYDYKYAHEVSKGISRNPRGWRMGGRENSCNVTLPLDVISEFEKAAPDRDIALLRPFPINVTLVNPENEIIKDLIIAKFQGNGRKLAPDSDVEYEYELFVIDIKLNVE